VAPEAQIPAGIYGKSFRIIGMVNGRAMAIFTLDYGMGRIYYGFIIFLMTFLAILPALVFNLEIYPVFCS
jgi:hypothetical protein